MKKFLFIAILISIFMANQAQDRCTYLNLGTKTSGIHFGNSSITNGIRITPIDKCKERVNGINISIWSSLKEDNSVGDINGIALGILTTQFNSLKGLSIGLGVKANDIKGISLGVFGTGTENSMKGISIGGLGTGCGGSSKGILIGGLGAGTGGNMKGFVFGGLGAGAGGDVKGIAIGGLGIGAGGNVKGLMFGGLGTGCGGNAKGILIGGLGSGCGSDIKGISIGGLGTGCGGNAKGIFLSGVGMSCGSSIKGICASGLLVKSGTEIKGAAITLGKIKTPVFKGFGVSGLFSVDSHHGLSIALFNNIKELHGVSFGILNYAGNNKPFFRILPVMNIHL